MDAANILKPALARQIIRYIGATTLDEYRKSIQRTVHWKSGSKRSSSILQLLKETLRNCLHNIKSTYEKLHEVTL